MVWSVKRLGTFLYARSLKSLFHLRSPHRYGILSRVGSPPHQEEVEAAGAEPTQGHLLHVEQAQDRLDQAEEEDIDVDFDIFQTWTRQRIRRGAQSQSCAGTVLNSASEVEIARQSNNVIRLVVSPALEVRCMRQ